MKKTIFIIIAIFAAAFLSKEFIIKPKPAFDTPYGGSAKVSVAVYELVFIPDGSQRGRELANYTLSANVSCAFDDITAAKSALADDLETQKDEKAGPGKEAVFTGAIEYNINSCDDAK